MLLVLVLVLVSHLPEVFFIKANILLCEDEINIVSFLSAELTHEGYRCDIAYDGQAAINLMSQNRYDLVLLDLMLPQKNGMEVLREIRKTSSVPVIVVTAKKEVFDKIALLDCGADDYVTKPFDTMELLARIRRNLCRSERQAVLSVRDLVVDAAKFEASLKNKTLPLTKTEFSILYFLLQNINTVQSREQIIRHVFGEFYGDSNIVDVNIKNIRSKLLKEEYIVTVRGIGYMIKD